MLLFSSTKSPTSTSVSSSERETRFHLYPGHKFVTMKLDYCKHLNKDGHLWWKFMMKFSVRKKRIKEILRRRRPSGRNVEKFFVYFRQLKNRLCCYYLMTLIFHQDLQEWSEEVTLWSKYNSVRAKILSYYKPHKKERSCQIHHHHKFTNLKNQAIVF